MRIVIDMQGAQSESKFRGIGRYSMSLAQAIARNAADHEVILVLNSLLSGTVDAIRCAFDGVLPQDQIRVWDGIGPTREVNADNFKHREISERLREAFIESLEPDIVLLTSLFEGLGDDSVTSVGIFDNKTPTAVILYDLIPLISPDKHFLGSKLHQGFYQRKITSLQNSPLLLAISESARQEAISALGTAPEAVLNISGACDASFKKLVQTPEQARQLKDKFAIDRAFIMYTGGADERKNLVRLIQAYGKLPKAVRQMHQLVFAGKMPVDYTTIFKNTAKDAGLASNDLIITGYLEDRDLLGLYNCCELFIFPSLHEGFGLPPLEAMACGAPVIAANASSLPEVVGLSEALFDPTEVESICDKMSQALTDQAFRARLIAHGNEHFKNFSWDTSALKALASMEVFVASRTPTSQLTVESGYQYDANPQDVLLIKLDHLGDFVLAIPAVMKLKARYPKAKIHAVVGSWCEPLARSLNVFAEIYTFDFFKKKSAISPTSNEADLTLLLAQLKDSYDIAIDLRRQPQGRQLLARVNANLKAAYQTHDPQIDRHINVLLKSEPDIPFKTTSLNETSVAEQMIAVVDALPGNVQDYLQLPRFDRPPHYPEGVSIAVFPYAGNEVKEWGVPNFFDLITQLSNSSAVSRLNVYVMTESEARPFLAIQSFKVKTHIGLEFDGLVTALSSDNICIANNSFGAHIGSYLGLSVVGIYGGHETVAEWAPVFKDSKILHASAECSPCHIATKAQCPYDLRCLTDIKVDAVYAEVLKVIKSAKTSSMSAPRKRGRQNKLLGQHRGKQGIRQDLISAIADLGLHQTDANLRLRISQAVVRNFPEGDARRLCVDISMLVAVDAKSGIQRVVRALLLAFINNVPAGYEIVPVYTTADYDGYRSAKVFMHTWLGNSGNLPKDEPILFRDRDIFLGLDLHPSYVPTRQQLFQIMRNLGVQTKFVVYDLLPITMPENFPAGIGPIFTQWFETIVKSQELICISKAVADQISSDFLPKITGQTPMRVTHFKLGCDIENSVPTTGAFEDAQELLSHISKSTSFLMVGTVEPRKNHEQVLLAFEQLWDEGREVNLIIVGKFGWNISDLAQRLKSHKFSGKRLFWLEGISDEYLRELYKACDSLIMASVGEGFGLPLIEASSHNLPLLVTDLPVFREVAGKYAYYFSGADARNIKSGIIEWLDLYQKNSHPVSTNMPRVTWQESAQQLLKLVCV